MSECLSRDPATGARCMLTAEHGGAHVAHVRWDNGPIAVVTQCPECAVGKHGNCDGDAWDFERDCPALCSCPCRP